jgi:hypothetical protein
MIRFSFLAAFLCLAGAPLFSQDSPLSYYLPDIDYDPSIPNPEVFFGHQVGEWHISHDKQYYYLKALAEASPRVVLSEYGRTHEGRPLVYLTITSEENQRQLEAIRQTHLRLSDPQRSEGVDLSAQPAVIYQAFSIHGNEPSGGNAATLVAYYLAAGQSPEVSRLLNEVIILLDPCLNPDGFQRFSTWVNMHRNKHLVTDSQDREFNEPWPRGRTNHYWFDLNRDWLMLQHPESRGRIEVFHHWKPQVLTDHHEMGADATFFFMPGEPQRTHPVTPPLNQELTAKIGRYHSEALDAAGSLYYTKEGFDDFYFGKGSTYPDANGCIGILFEQASSRGHAQETINGVLTFPFTIRNQVLTAFSTQKAALEMRGELLEYQRDFFREGLAEARRDARKAFVFGEAHDGERLAQFVELLRRHQVEVYRLAQPLNAGGQRFDPAWSYIVPLEQTQYRMIRGIFDTLTVFQDSLFYDVSSWTLPLAFNLACVPLTARQYNANLLGQAAEGLGMPLAAPTPRPASFAYLFEWDEFYAPRALYYLLKRNLRVRVATKPFSIGGRAYAAGTIMTPVQNQPYDPESIYQMMQIAARAAGVTIHEAHTGLSESGIDLGSRNFEPLRLPRVLLLVGNGISNSEVGQVWQLLDEHYYMPVAMFEADDLGGKDLNSYNFIFMANGNYQNISEAGVEKLRRWVQEGGVIVASRNATRWIVDKGLGHVTFREEAPSEGPTQRRPYGSLGADRGAGVIGGAIFEARLDLTHPLAFGYRRETLPVFRSGTLFFEPGKNAYSTPLTYTAKPLMSGYTHPSNLTKLAGSASIVVTGTGRGKVICMADDPTFRAFWKGTTKLFANALFFGHVIDNNSREPMPRREGGPARPVAGSNDQ